MLDQPTDNLIFGESLLSGEVVASEFRSALATDTVFKHRQKQNTWQITRSLRSIGIVLMPMLAEAFWRSDLSAWLAAYDYHANRLPRWLQTHLKETGIGPPSGPVLLTFDYDDGDRRVRFPKIERAAASLMNRNVMNREQFELQSEAVKAKAFTIAGDLSERTIGKVRDVLAKSTLDGPSLPEFSNRVTEALGKSPIGLAHLENVYRTNIQAAYRDGRESLISGNPIIENLFPYQEYLPIHDGRVRENHKALGSLGISGTGVYRRDDPFWDYYTPPWGFNCRCSVNLLTLEAAARKGAQEAIDWLKSGVPPVEPEHRWKSIPFEPEPGFGQRSGVTS